MSYEEAWPEHTLDQRRAAIKKTIHPVTIEELRESLVKSFRHCETLKP